MEETLIIRLQLGAVHNIPVASTLSMLIIGNVAVDVGDPTSKLFKMLYRFYSKNVISSKLRDR